MTPIDTVADRFILTGSSPRRGGTAHVFRARDHEQDQRVVAVKLYDGTGHDSTVLRECFHRERAALTALRHPNIVQFVAAGYDERREQHYVAMEWLEHDLLAYLAERHEALPLTWPVVAREILVPLLSALGAASAQRIVHRDVKPANVMVGADGTLKLTDFGLAKLLDSVRFGVTVSHFRSAPYAPPEAGTGTADERGDLYSLGMTALHVLLPDPGLLSSEDHAALVKLCDVGSDGEHILGWLTATDPAERPATARLALYELEKLLAFDPKPKPASRRRLHVVLTQAAKEQARAQLNHPTIEAAARALQADVRAEGVALTRQRDQPAGWQGSESAVRLDLIGAELLHTARFAAEATGSLIVTGIRDLPPDTLERRREGAMALEHAIVFTDGWATQREDADALIEALSRHEADQAVERVRREEARLFDRWSELLEAKKDLERRREDPIAYDDIRREPGQLVFRTTRDVDERYLGQTRRVALEPAGQVVGEIAGIGARELTMVVQRGNPDALPGKGMLRVDSGPSKVAIDRQARALQDVRDGQTAQPALGALLARPDEAGPLVRRDPPSALQPLDEPKQRAVAVALASPDFTLVQGPPGTGKTTFIAELLAHELNSRDRTRIVLSAQTHVAVDAAAVALAKLAPQRRIVRIGRAEKIDPSAEGLGVDMQRMQWSEEVRDRARGYLHDWGVTRGLDPVAIDTHARAGELAALVTGIAKADARISALRDEEHRLLDVLTAPTPVEDQATTTTDTTLDLEDELAAVHDEAEARKVDKARLSHARDGLAAQLSEQLGLTIAPQDDLTAVLDAHFGLDPDEREVFLSLAALQDEWLSRFGQGDDFRDALLRSADVVAGTCVGLAGAIGDEIAFDLAVVDEASKAAPTEALVPMARSRRWVIVGDPQQLPPFIDAELVEREILSAHGLTRNDLRETLFTQLTEHLPADRQVVLSVQHRMLSPIGDLISHCFYDGTLESARGKRSDFECLAGPGHPPVLWLSTSKLGRARHDQAVGTTYWNRSEVREVCRYLDRLQARAARTGEQLSVGVIAGYGEQVQRLQRDVRPWDAKWTNLAIDVYPVDSFQGQQRDVIVYSVTRSNEDLDMGFLRAEERVNVALSRGRDALVIVGDARFCSRAHDGANALAKVLRHMEKADGCSVVPCHS
ncbi:MAG: AAA domain-containing protein [Actinomycetota bacterium]|nr:AAA domain-containing protein [Actinomycetota bacterium]